MNALLASLFVCLLVLVPMFLLGVGGIVILIYCNHPLSATSKQNLSLERLYLAVADCIDLAAAGRAVAEAGRLVAA